MKDTPFIWQDIWIYNYLAYEAKIKLKKNGLIEKYEREIIPVEKQFQEIKKLFE